MLILMNNKILQVGKLSLEIVNYLNYIRIKNKDKQNIACYKQYCLLQSSHLAYKYR